MSTPEPRQTLDKAEALVYLPAFILFRLAFSPRKMSPVHIQDSLLINGWLKEHPAIMRISPGNYAGIDGCHRLGFLNSINRLDMEVPTLIMLF